MRRPNECLQGHATMQGGMPFEMNGLCGVAMGCRLASWRDATQSCLLRNNALFRDRLMVGRQRDEARRGGYHGIATGMPFVLSSMNSADGAPDTTGDGLRRSFEPKLAWADWCRWEEYRRDEASRDSDVRSFVAYQVVAAPRTFPIPLPDSFSSHFYTLDNKGSLSLGRRSEAHQGYTAPESSARLCPAFCRALPGRTTNRPF